MSAAQLRQQISIIQAKHQLVRRYNLHYSDDVHIYIVSA